MEGEFKVDDKSVEILSASPSETDFVIRMNAKQRQKLNQSARWAQEQMRAGNVDEARVAHVLERTVEQNVPHGKTIIEHLRDPAVGNIGTWVSILLALIVWLSTMDSGISIEDAQQVADETARTVLRELEHSSSTLPTPPLPAPPAGEQPPPATELPTPKTR
ncbi:hypothetical protein ASF76_08060 [Microbacterium sp. Leaf151]|nr:hypothetical protein ASF76_08060 [Microbacterium sp. Leaf151]